MRRIGTTILITAALGLSMPAFAGGGGAGAPETDTAVASCVQKGADGKPVRKLSSEEVCPIYQFWREDCGRDGQAGLITPIVENHCSSGALGLGGPDKIITGSVIRLPR